MLGTEVLVFEVFGSESVNKLKQLLIYVELNLKVDTRIID